MKPLTLSISIPVYRDGVKIAGLIREHDDTADVHLHEAKRGTGWTITAHICIPEDKTGLLRRRIRETGALCVVRDADQA
jgi:hypothetical protein